MTMKIRVCSYFGPKRFPVAEDAIRAKPENPYQLNRDNVVLKLKISLIAGCLLVALGIFYFVQQKSFNNTADSEILPPAVSYPVNRSISYSFTLENQTSMPVANSQFWTLAPVKRTATQKCVGISSSHKYETITDEYGNQVLHYVFDVIPPFGKKVVSITALLNLSPISNPVQVSGSREFLNPQKWVESDHPDIIKMAQGFRAASLEQTIANMFDWVSTNIKYAGYLRQSRGALYALRHRKGDCTEYMSLFAALCRAREIPAKCIAGYVCSKNTVLKPSGFHNWVEFYDGANWQCADPQLKVLYAEQANARYIAMKVITGSGKGPASDFNRFKIEGKGLKAKMNG